MGRPAAIKATGVEKAYGDHPVLDGIDLDVAEGSVFALLGPNGSGKTTTVRILATLLRADAGRIEVAGHDVVTEADEVRAAIGVTGQLSAVDDLLTGEENLRLMADLHHLGRAAGRQRAQELLEQLELVDAGDRAASTYSGGMRRRLDLAMTLVGRPEVIFLDEPSTGLDPRSRRNLWGIVGDLVADGTTVLLTTQYLDEADALADLVALLDGGRIVAAGTPAELKRLVPGDHVSVELVDAAARQAALTALPEAVASGGSLTVTVPTDGSVAALRRVLARLDDEAVRNVAVHAPDLDDVFLALTGRSRPALEVAS